MSERPVDAIGHGAIDCVGDLTTTQNYCAGQLWKNSDGTVDSETIFVKTDCNNRQPLPVDQQDAIYQKPGVPIDHGLYIAFADAWGDLASSSTDNSAVSCFSTSELTSTLGAAADCAEALATLYDHPDWNLPIKPNGYIYKLVIRNIMFYRDVWLTLR